MIQLKKGILVAVEGIDGSGKSTLTSYLASMLKQYEIPVLVTREPGGTQLGKYLRKVLHERQDDIRISPKAEYLLFASDRAQHFQDVIKDALEKKFVIISDRMSDSSVAYQGFARGVEIDMIEKINQWALEGHLPDITIYLRIDLETAAKRLELRSEALTSFEQEDKLFVERVINGFDTIMKNKRNLIVLDATQRMEKVAKSAFEQLYKLLEKNIDKKGIM